MQKGISPIPNSESGYIYTYDPDHKSFKAAMVTIIFSGVYLEALLHLLIVKTKGIEKYKQCDRKKREYEKKLKLLGCNDKKIIEECEHYRTVRLELVHEKAYLDQKVIRVAQKEATRAFDLVMSINAHFGVNIGM